MLLFKEIKYLLFADTKHRADDGARQWFDTYQTLKTGAPDNVHQYGFHLIIGVMRHADTGSTNVFSQTLKIIIAQIPCRQFDT